MRFLLVFAFLALSYLCTDIINTGLGVSMAFGLGGYIAPYVLPLLPESLLPTELMGYGLFAFGAYFFLALAGLALLRSSWFLRFVYFVLTCVGLGYYSLFAFNTPYILTSNSNIELESSLIINAFYVGVSFACAFILSFIFFKKKKLAKKALPQNVPAPEVEGNSQSKAGRVTNQSVQKRPARNSKSEQTATEKDLYDEQPVTNEKNNSGSS